MSRSAKWRVCVMLAASAWFWTAPVIADHQIGADGSLVLGWCERSPDGLASEPVSARCEGYLLGVLDAHGDRNTIHGFHNCLPHSATIGQLRDAIVKWLQGHTEKLHQPGHSLVAEALSEEFPCTK